MSSVVRHDKSLQIIEIVYDGMLTSKNLEESTSDGITLNVELGINNVLIDAAHMDSAAYFLEVHDLPLQYAESGLSRKVRIALVMPRTTVARRIAKFYVDACIIHGWTVRPFEAREAAIEWLTSFEYSRLQSV
ncbi:MAG: STAS/SEC14 domain-containing protein [Gammaproteobacteria bacterium]|nr:STAS/SEC14 domain-containing protein [Gammaproteobacteria bacterium]